MCRHRDPTPSTLSERLHVVFFALLHGPHPLPHKLLPSSPCLSSRTRTFHPTTTTGSTLVQTPLFGLSFDTRDAWLLFQLVTAMAGRGLLWVRWLGHARKQRVEDQSFGRRLFALFVAQLLPFAVKFRQLGMALQGGLGKSVGEAVLLPGPDVHGCCWPWVGRHFV